MKYHSPEHAQAIAEEYARAAAVADAQRRAEEANRRLIVDPNDKDAAADVMEAAADMLDACGIDSTHTRTLVQFFRQ